MLGSLLLFISIAPLLFSQFQSNITISHYPKIDWYWFLLPLLIALTMRLPWFGYREIQGDEGIVLVRAADALLGDRVEMLLHRKGPMEILLSMGVWGLAGEIDDVWVRLPFLLCNLLSLLLFYALVHRWFGRTVAVVATSLLAIMGFHVAFSRVVQYQSLVMMWGIGATLAAERYRLSGRAWELLLSAILLAAGLLSHYDAVLFAPAILLLCFSRWRVDQTFPLRQIGAATAVGALMLASFYIPFAFGPDFQNALGYLLDERVGTESGGSLADVWQMVTFYNSSWYIVGLIGFALAGSVALQQRSESGWMRGGIAAFALVPLLFYTAVVSVPRTHVYTFFPGIIVMAALGIEWISEKRAALPRLYGASWAGLAGLAGWFLLCASYIWLLFTWGPAEIQRNWAEKRPNQILYWTTWDSPPEFGLFGFPYQAGWRNMRQADLDGLVYASNEEAEITNWYMAQAQRTHCNTADIFLLAQNVQD
ncbi:MAG: glycosyltransferase family 39 protein, partial [Cyanobacteria bacterium P01_D01_bin.2]